ncbi:hypothetical protein C8R45DRAFT_1080776 [Mycena sanguinolenta]|nr:hypothetical protein C8R45DRAFT_1080776 [Mycena sanguinolenta]
MAHPTTCDDAPVHDKTLEENPMPLSHFEGNLPLMMGASQGYPTLRFDNTTRILPTAAEPSGGPPSTGRSHSKLSATPAEIHDILKAFPYARADVFARYQSMDNIETAQTHSRTWPNEGLKVIAYQPTAVSFESDQRAQIPTERLLAAPGFQVPGLEMVQEPPSRSSVSTQATTDTDRPRRRKHYPHSLRSFLQDVEGVNLSEHCPLFHAKEWELEILHTVSNLDDATLISILSGLSARNVEEPFKGLSDEEMRKFIVAVHTLGEL